MTSIESLQKQHWYVTEAGLKKLSGGESKSDSDLIKTALDTDLKDFGRSHIPEHWNKKEEVAIEGVLQVQKVRNITAPKANEESQTAPRLLRLTLSDGHTAISCLEVGRWNHIGLRTPPGTKVRLKRPVTVRSGFLLLPPEALVSLGGNVPAMIDKWLMNKAFASQSVRPVGGPGGGPPKWVPFGRSISAAHHADLDFKAMAGVNGAEAAEDPQFEQQRRAQIAALAAAQPKQFGGGQRRMEDGNVHTLMAAGFSREDSEAALRITCNDLGRALQNLQRMRSRRQAGAAGAAEEYLEQRGERGGRRGRRGRDRFERDPEPSSRPSQPVTLMDFVGAQIQGSGSSENRRSPSPVNNYSSADNYTSNNTNNPATSSYGRGGRGGRGAGEYAGTARDRGRGSGNSSRPESHRGGRGGGRDGTRTATSASSDGYVEGRRARQRREQGYGGGGQAGRAEEESWPELGGSRSQQGGARGAGRHEFKLQEMCLARHPDSVQMQLGQVVQCRGTSCFVYFVDLDDRREVPIGNMQPLGFGNQSFSPAPTDGSGRHDDEEEYSHLFHHSSASGGQGRNYSSGDYRDDDRCERTDRGDRRRGEGSGGGGNRGRGRAGYGGYSNDTGSRGRQSSGDVRDYDTSQSRRGRGRQPGRGYNDRGDSWGSYRNGRGLQQDSERNHGRQNEYGDYHDSSRGYSQNDSNRDYGNYNNRGRGYRDSVRGSRGRGGGYDGNSRGREGGYDGNSRGRGRGYDGNSGGRGRGYDADFRGRGRGYDADYGQGTGYSTVDDTDDLSALMGSMTFVRGGRGPLRRDRRRGAR